MDFRDHDIMISYKSIGENSISDIINPLLGDTLTYKRSVGFFSSDVLSFISIGILKLAKNERGKIMLITSPKISSDDYEAIKYGYKLKDSVVIDSFKNEFDSSIHMFNDQNLKLLSELIAKDILEIKIVIKKDLGMYHDKLAILTDYNNNEVVFVGSSNETAGGYSINYEKIRVFTSWKDKERVEDEKNEFDDIWFDRNEYLEIYDAKEAIQKSIIEITDKKKDVPNEPYVLYPYQIEAKEAWIKNGYLGFFVMATGTGKTITSIYAIKELIKDKNPLTVIAVPYKHLISQWKDDVTKIIPEANVHLVSGEMGAWEEGIIVDILRRKSGSNCTTIIISTIESFYSSRFKVINDKYKGPRLLVVDEAHNFLNKIKEKKYDIEFEYRLGLSATPIFGKDMSKTRKLVDFFGGIVYELPIEKAIGKFLVNYNYHPIFVNATYEEERKFDLQTRLMAQSYKNDVIIDVEKFQKAYKNRLRIISMASEKIDGLEKYIKYIKHPDHFIIYCSDGKLGDVKHLSHVQSVLDMLDFKSSKFTASEKMDERISLIHNFNEGYIDTMVAIRCLDEGINIPSIKTALILSSNDNYREFVQRRGRILRKYKDKKTADIVDILVLPSNEMTEFAKIELRRFYEYSRLALNHQKNKQILDELLNRYGLLIKDIEFDYDMEIMEDESDE